MSRVAAGQSLSVNQLVDMEWRFGGIIVYIIILYIMDKYTYFPQPFIHRSGYFQPSVTAADSDMDKVGNSFLQLKMVLNKGSGTEEVFMGKYKIINIFYSLKSYV